MAWLIWFVIVVVIVAGSFTYGRRDRAGERRPGTLAWWRRRRQQNRGWWH